jgi:hypothetical protein
MSNLFNEKAKQYKSRPNHISAAKYEKGMENGWVIEFYGLDNDFGYSFKIFDTEEEANVYYNLKPLQEEKIVSNGKETTIQYEVEYENPKPCIWHIEKREIVDFGHSWDEQVYEVIENDNWIVQWEGNGELEIYNDDYMKSDWELDE